jgi:hypothetical protein
MIAEPQPKISHEAANLISSKLKERLKISKDKVKAKKELEHQKTMVLPEDKSFLNEDEIGTPPSHYDHKNEGFTEKVDDQNEAFVKAIKTIALLKRAFPRKKNIKPKPDTTEQFQQSIPILNFQLASVNGVQVRSSNQYNLNKTLKTDEDDKCNIKIDNPNSILHIANFHQNKEFEQYGKVLTEDGNQILKINAPDAHTFFRLHHEIDEMKRKQGEFERMRRETFDKRQPEDLIHYDDALDKFENMDKEDDLKKWKNKGNKDYQQAVRIAEKLKEDKKKTLMDKNLAFELFASYKP